LIQGFSSRFNAHVAEKRAEDERLNGDPQELVEDYFFPFLPSSFFPLFLPFISPLLLFLSNYLPQHANTLLWTMPWRPWGKVCIPQ